MAKIRSVAAWFSTVALWYSSAASALAAETSFDVIRDQIANHPGQTGALVLDTGEEALLARAWLAGIGVPNSGKRSQQQDDVAD